jgi:hypothetical protein
MTCCEWWLAIVLRADRGAEARQQRRYHAALTLAALQVRAGQGRTYFRMLC